MRLTSQDRGEHHVTIPRHDPVRVGTLSAILDSVARHRGVSRNDLLKELTR